MDCSCSSCDADVLPDFFNETHVVAKKDHVCCECGRNIKSGERYEYIAGKWDGEFQVFKTCKQCEQIRKDFCVCNLGSLQEEIGELLGYEVL